MSHIIVITLAIVSIAVTTCRALPDIHKQMSPQQLQSIFHVEDHESVPQYEVIKLLHHNNEELSAQQYSNYRRRKRSIEEFTSHANDLHHIKKDLSKTPYYSATKMASKTKALNHLDNTNESNSKRKDVKHIEEHKVQVHAFGEKLNLTLKKTQGLFKKGELHNLPMWFMDKEANATHGINLEKIVDEHSHSSDKIGEVYQDEENMAAILMRRHEVTGDLIMEGSIGHDMVIKPLPHELSPEPEESHHVIYKRSTEHHEHLSDFAYMEPDDLSTHEKLEKLQDRRKRSAHRNTLAELEEEQEELEAEDGVATDESSPHKRGKRHAPYMIYPEVLVIVDYDGYRLHGGDNLQVKRYFIAFWNGVDLRYRLLKEPKIRVSIAGIIISRGRDATPYLERNRVGRDAIDSAAALTDMGKYLFRERRLPVYDIAVAITKYDMCRRRKGGRCTKGTAGFAYVGGACVVNRRLEKVNSVAIIEDTGGFSGIIVAAHEVGHLLGAVHDGSPPPSYLGGPGAQRCRWEDGFIMSDLRHTERGFRWSACSVQSFQHFLNGATATCLYNVPHEDNALGRSLPGTLLSLDAQCRRDRGTYACFKDERVCAQLFCFDAQTGYCVAYRPAAEGSTCGNNLHCLDGRCTALPVASNLITNYGGQYRSGYNNSLNNPAASKHLYKANVNNEAYNADDEGDNAEGEDSGDDNDESNETIEKQKRKLNNITPSISTTITTQQPTPQKQQASPPIPNTSSPPSHGTSAIATATTTSLSDLAMATTAKPDLRGESQYGQKTSSINPTLLEAYVKKLQALSETSTESSLAGAIKKTTVEDTQTLDKTERSIQPTLQFEAQILKRTPSPYSSSSSISTKNPHNKKTTTSSSSSATISASGGSSSSSSTSYGSSNSYKFIPQPLKIIQETSSSPDGEIIQQRQTSSHQTSGAGVTTFTNYIGDNTNRLASIVQQHPKPQQQQKTYSKVVLPTQANNSQLQQTSSSTYTTGSDKQQPQPLQQKHPHHQQSSLPSLATSRRPKIKTQKLIRRLRTQIK
ncbi:sol narae metalloprotease isoform X2 [Haematobia irritans]|uniref:sol narae metalloprotease isoform X2 n=1 Tax=Haematobia irritans TaxID=7368 RepID=UPI003F508281